MDDTGAVKPSGAPAVSVEEGLRHLIDASKDLLGVLETDKLLDVLMERVLELTRAERGFLLLAEEGGLGFRTGRRADRSVLEERDAVISRSVAEEVHRTGTPILSANALGDEALRNRKSVFDLRLMTVMCVPLRAKERPLGVLYVDSSQIRSPFDATGLAVFQALADLAAIALENARLYTLATTDLKTGLANSGFFRNRLEAAAAAACRGGTPVGLVLVDLDHFKRVNDTYGHPAGDVVLRGVASILKRSVRAGDVAARFGGEEFALLLAPSAEGSVDGTTVADRVRRAIASRPFVTADGTGIRVTASFGVACCPAPDIDGPDALLAAADRALYEAKRTGRNRVVEAAPAAALAG